MNKYFYYALYALLGCIFFQGGLELLSINPKLVYIPLVGILLFLVPKWEMDRNVFLMSGFVVAILLSFFMNQVSLDDFLFYFPRYYLNYFLTILLCIVFHNSKFDFSHSSRLIQVISIFWIFQVFVAMFFVFVQQERIEGRCGFIGNSGGGIAATISQCIFAFFLARGFASHWKWGIVAFLIPFIGYASQKRSIFYLVPIAACITVFFIWTKRKQLYGVKTILYTKYIRNFIFFLLLVAASAPFIFIALRTTHFFGKEQENSIQSVSDAMVFLGDSLDTYSVRSTRGMSSNRIETTMRLLELSLESPGNFFFGINPLSAVVFVETNSGGNASMEEYGVEYGFTGLATAVFSAGYPAALFLLLFFGSSLWTLYKLNTEDWKKEWKWFPVATFIMGICGLVDFIFSSTSFIERNTLLWNYLLFWYIAVNKPSAFRNEETSLSEMKCVQCGKL